MITSAFDPDTQPVMGPEEFYGKRRQLCDTCIVTFSKRIASFVTGNFSCKRVGKILCANGGTPVYLFSHEGKEFAFYMSRIGSALAGTDVIDANWLTGAKSFVMFGSAGSLCHTETTGKYVIPTEAFRDEGLSYHYAPASDYIRIANSGRLAALFTELSLPYVTGRVWTTDAFYRETRGAIEKRKKEGCIAVEMELAGVQAVCDYHGFSLYDFLVTGDVLDTPSYEIASLQKVNHDNVNFLTALKIAMRIS